MEWKKKFLRGVCNAEVQVASNSNPTRSNIWPSFVCVPCTFLIYNIFTETFNISFYFLPFVSFYIKYIFCRLFIRWRQGFIISALSWNFITFCFVHVFFYFPLKISFSVSFLKTCVIGYLQKIPSFF